MKRLVESTRTIIYIAMCVLFSILVYIYFDYVFKRSTSFWIVGGILLTVVVVADYLARRHVTNLFMFFFIHIALIGLTLAVPPAIADKVILTVISVAFLFLAIGFWRKDSNERSMYVIDVPLGLLMFFLIAYMHASISKSMSDAVAAYAYLAGVIYLMLYFMREYLNKMLSYSLSSGNFSKEMDRIFSTNFSLIMLFNIVIVFAIIVANTIFSDSSFNFIGRFLRWIARKLFGFLEGFHSEEEPQQQVDQYETRVIGQHETEEAAPVFSRGGGGSNVGEAVLEGILLALFIIALCFVVYAVYRFIKVYMHRHNKTDDIVKKVEAGEKKDKAEPEKKKRVRSLFGTNSDKVRRIYRDKIKNFMKYNEKAVMRDSFTTDEIKGTVVKYQQGDKFDVETLTQIYKRARYSDKEITKADVELAKNVKLH